MSANAPNIVFVYADDLGRGMLSCYGQTWFETPNIDRLASEGVRFTNSYGCAFCAPARASLLTGVHDSHEGRWGFTSGGIYTRLQTGELSYDDITETIHNTAMAAAPNEIFLPQIPQESGYVTGEIGKLEWGFATTAERIRRHGWDYHFGYYDHVRCHGFYPSFLWENGNRVILPGNHHLFCGRNPGIPESDEHRAFRRMRLGRGTYSQDVFNQKIREFIRTNASRPFFLFHPSQLPHGPIAVPDIHPGVADVKGLTEYEKEYASMVLRLDDTVGMIIEELEHADVLDDTMFIFCSDNGHEVYPLQDGRTSRTHNVQTGEAFDNITSRFTSETGGDVFNGNDGMAGIKFSNWEGGVRIPMIVRWPRHTNPGTVSDDLVAAYDLLPTIAELLSARVPGDKDGQSFLSVLDGRGWTERPHDPVVFASGLGPAMVTADGYKLRRIEPHDSFQLYNIVDDPVEQLDLAAERPDVVARLGADLLARCDGDFANGTPEAHRLPYNDRRLSLLSPVAGNGLVYTP